MARPPARTLVYDSSFQSTIPAAQPQERRPLVQIKAYNPWLLDILDNWYGELLPGGHPDLFSRLREIEDAENFTAAFWELVILRYLREHGYDIEYSPTIDDKTPDFYLRRQDMIADVVSISDPHHRDADRAHIDELVRLINREAIPFDVTIVSFSFVRGTNPRLSNIVQWLMNLSNLPQDEREAQAHEYEDSDARIEVLLRSRTQGDVVKAVGMYSLDADRLKKVIKGRLRDKVKKYQRPLIVFVCQGLGFWSVDKDSLHMSLYGDWLVHFSRVPGGEPSGPDTACNGVFYNRWGPAGRPANTKLSAVIYVNRRLENRRLCIWIGAYHNPEAERLISREVLSPMAQFLISSEEGGNCTLAWIDDDGGWCLGGPLPERPYR